MNIWGPQADEPPDLAAAIPAFNGKYCKSINRSDRNLFLAVKQRR